MATTTTYVTRTDFNAFQRELRDDLYHEIGSVNARIGRVEKDVAVLKGDVAVLKEDVTGLKRDMNRVKEDVSVLKRDFRSMSFEQQRSTAWLRNRLQNVPTVRIDPIPIMNSVMSVGMWPQNTQFPRNAKEFYSLRYPTTCARRRMLRYLVTFYDVPWPGKPVPSFHTTTTEVIPSEPPSRPPSVPESSHKQEDELDIALADEDTAAMAVDVLEGILGLSEDNFITFTERARQREKQKQEDWMGYQPAPKRKLSKAPSGEPLPVRQALSVREGTGSEVPSRALSSSGKDAVSELAEDEVRPTRESSSLPDTASGGVARST